MSLMRLLKTGKSLVGGMDNSMRYEMRGKGMLPTFGKDSLKGAQQENALAVSKSKTTSPFKDNSTPKKQDGTQATNRETEDLQSGESASSPRAAVNQPAGNSKQEKVSGASSEKISLWRAARRFCEKLNPFRSRTPARISRRERPLFARPAVQTELSLDNVRVVRNDLSDTDLEVVALKSKPAKSALPVAGAKGSGDPAGTENQATSAMRAPANDFATIEQ